MRARLRHICPYGSSHRSPLTAVTAAFLFIMMSLSAPARSQPQMELHLVLAFDVSASVNDAEFDLQRIGTARALRHASVRAAIEQAEGGVAISIVQWSSIGLQALGLDWAVLRTSRDVEAFADQVRTMPRKLSGGGTMIHTGLEFAARQLDSAPGSARRRVIDLSGNGRADDHDGMLDMRDRLVRDGVIINALAVEEHKDDLTTYFHRFLIGGPAAFVITAEEFEDFSDAMRRKLHREITGPEVSRHRRGSPARWVQASPWGGPDLQAGSPGALREGHPRPSSSFQKYSYRPSEYN